MSNCETEFEMYTGETELEKKKLDEMHLALTYILKQLLYNEISKEEYKRLKNEILEDFIRNE